MKELTHAENEVKQAARRAVPDHVELLERHSKDLDRFRSAVEDLDHLAARTSRVLGGLTEQLVADLLMGSVAPWERRAAESQRLLNHADRALAAVRGADVELPAAVPERQVATDAARRKRHFKEDGRRGLWIFAPRVVKETAYLEEQCLVSGRKPETELELAMVIAYVELLQDARKIAALWGEPRSESSDPQRLIERARDQTKELQDLLRFVDSPQAAALALLPPDRRSGLAEPDGRRQWAAAVDLARARARERTAIDALEGICGAVRRCRSETSHLCMKDLEDAAGGRNVEAWRSAWHAREQFRARKERLERWRSLVDRLDRFRPDLATLVRTSAGDPAWTGKIREIADAWAWSNARAWLRDRSDTGTYAERVQQLHVLQARVETVTAELVSKRAWGAFFRRLDENTRQSLIAWTKALARVGRATGKYANRHRRTARRYLMQCVPKIPAWVMPLYRLWDTVDAQAGLFDTVIVDEASQAGVDSFPLLLLAKRIIVVGDDKQNSPEAVGVAEADVARLAREHLRQFRFRDEYRPDTSLFDHAERSFGNAIALREHFRCVPEIIRFSNDLCYRDTPLIPLRQAPPGRLPPLRSRFVSEGRCEGTAQRIHNQAEAQAVVDRIEQVIADDAYTGKSLGVIALQGHQQARRIEELLAKRLEPKVIDERHLRCGGPAAFQGDERDVMFLSLVMAPNVRHRALTGLADQRRFNVAMSRARDQVWLFHSMKQHDLGPTDLRRRLVGFFENPGGEVEQQWLDREQLERAARLPRQRGSQPDPYDSWLEVDVARELLRRRFRVLPQVAVAGYRIDLVVEGAAARLAVECDGDAWHGPERYESDLARQRQLEHAGLRFVRVRESDFYLDREAATETIVAACTERGIRPLDEARDRHAGAQPRNPKHRVTKGQQHARRRPVRRSSSPRPTRCRGRRRISMLRRRRSADTVTNGDSPIPARIRLRRTSPRSLAKSLRKTARSRGHPSTGSTSEDARR